MTQPPPQTGVQPGGGILRRISRREALKALLYTGLGGTAATVFNDHVETYWPDSWHVHKDDATDPNIVSRLGLDKEVEYLAVQIDGRVRRVNYKGIENDPEFGKYVDFQKSTKIIKLERGPDGSYTSSGITEGGAKVPSMVNDAGVSVPSLTATYTPGQPPNPGSSDKMDLVGMVQISLPAPATK